MNEELLDEVLSGKAFEGLSLKLHKEGKDVILHADELPNGGNYIVYPNKKAYLISYDETLKKSILGRELTQEEYELIGIEHYA
ncbi:hypothetical protein [Sulfurospirillum cavolei]|uniref:hypothetical protein n=1 Tax=Sulfurospirillum cavolei TaxID=366522 RepID=UPI000764C1C6|nr:hypothetical protein [Sulfurospirillum cavolei]